MDETIISFSQMIDLLTSVIIGWVILICIIFTCFCCQKQWKHKKEQRELQKQTEQKEQEELNKLEQTVQKMLAGEYLYFFREDKKIADQHGNELPQLKDYYCRLAPFADAQALPSKAFRVFFDTAKLSKDGRHTLLFRPDASGWIDDFEIEGLAPDGSVILTHPIMGTLFLHSTEYQTSHIGQKVAVYQVTRFKDGVYSSFCHIPSKESHSFM